MKNKIDDMTIGLWTAYDAGRLITWGEVKREVANPMLSLAFSLMDYTDRRRTTNLERFNCDPFTGQIIQWDKMREEAKEIEGIKEANKGETENGK